MDEEVPRLLRAAENDSAVAFAEAGLLYCKGLYHHLAHDPHQALHFLNRVKKRRRRGVGVGIRVGVVGAEGGLRRGQELVAVTELDNKTITCS
jgi:hypothetical protein